jgi:hypothetical protein
MPEEKTLESYVGEYDKLIDTALEAMAELEQIRVMNDKLVAIAQETARKFEEVIRSINN